MKLATFRCAFVLGSLLSAACSSDTKPVDAAGGATPQSGGAASGGSPGAGGASAAGSPAQTAGATQSAGGSASSAGSPAAQGGGGGSSTGGSSTGGRPAAGAGGAAPVSGGAPSGGSNVTDPGTEGDGDFTVSTITTQPDLTDRGAAKGKRFTFIMDSTKSKIFDGSDSTVQAAKRRLTRRVTVYVPAAYKDGTAAPILVMQDGPPDKGWGDGPPIDAVSRALDNLTISKDAARKIPAFLAIGVENGGDDAQGSERGLEYDTLSDRYARFVDSEVLPAVLANAEIKAAYPKIAITSDPEGRGTYGCSSGAAAAFTMAWFRPDLFRRVITYSGTFVAQQASGQPESALYPLGAWEYHSSKALIATEAKKPLRVHLNVNENDNGVNNPESGHHNWVLANQHMAAALAAKGYHYRFDYVKGLGHCDYNAWRATLADTLVWLWRGYPNQ